MRFTGFFSSAGASAAGASALETASAVSFAFTTSFSFVFLATFFSSARSALIASAKSVVSNLAVLPTFSMSSSMLILCSIGFAASGIAADLTGTGSSDKSTTVTSPISLAPVIAMMSSSLVFDCASSGVKSPNATAICLKSESVFELRLSKSSINAFRV